jgi:putative transposase
LKHKAFLNPSLIRARGAASFVSFGLKQKDWDIELSRSPRSMPSKLKQIEYPGHNEVRLVSKNGGIRWRHVRVPVSHILAGEYIGFEEIDDGIWEVYYGPIWLGRFDEKIMLIMDQRGRYFRRKV